MQHVICPSTVSSWELFVFWPIVSKIDIRNNHQRKWSFLTIMCNYSIFILSFQVQINYPPWNKHFAPENRLSQKDMSFFQPSILSGLCYCLGKVYIHCIESIWRSPLPKGGLVRGHDKSIHRTMYYRSCAYFPGAMAPDFQDFRESHPFKECYCWWFRHPKANQLGWC